MEATERQAVSAADQKLLVGTRIAFNAVAVGLAVLSSIHARESVSVDFILIATGLISAGSAIVVATWKERSALGWLWALPFDLLAIVMLTNALRLIDGAAFPFALMLALIHALILQRRHVLLVSAAIGTAHLVGHALGGISLIPFVAWMMNAISLVLITFVVAAVVQRMRQREEEIGDALAARDVAARRMERRVSELQAVSRITEVIHSTLDFDTVGPVVLDILGKVIGIDTCCLFVIDKDESSTLFSASMGRPIEMPDYADPKVLESASLEGHFSCTAVYDHAHMMVLFCASAEDLAEIDDEDRLVLGAVASELVVAVENSRLYKLTKKLAVTDDLTSLANYRSLQQRLDDEIERTRRYGKKLSLVMLDVDDFKGFNDANGHLAGDVALADLGTVMRSVVREVDLVARYGGEEFSIVLPETDATGAFVVAEKIREEVANHRFADADGVLSRRLTVSLGVATYPTHASDKESLLREADDALYQAKGTGRNRVRAARSSASNDTQQGV